ncbi:MAG TPA: hypothetical protein VNC11_15325 [Gemmatimonadaceae bacterium]|jgi:hypothetical protein|nr:hypothetical protein [Gemmatimonadaceae bacterium]
MTPIIMARLIVILIAAILFGFGIRTDQSALRWAGIGFLVAALLMRFIGRGRYNDTSRD